MPKKAAKEQPVAGATALDGAKDEAVVIPPVQIDVMRLRLIGDTPLIVNQFGSKSRTQIREKQSGAPRQGTKAPKDIEAAYEGSLYRMQDGRYGFPASAFKKAAVAACVYIDGLYKTRIRGAFHVLGDLVHIEGSEPVMREDIVRVGKFKDAADLRYRGEFSNWAVTLTIRFNSGVISPAHIANIFNTAGFSIGVGEWRPERDGTNGTFHVGSEAE